MEPIQLAPKPGQPGAPLPRPCRLLLPWRTQLGKEADEVAIIKMLKLPLPTSSYCSSSRSSSSAWSEFFPQIRDAFLRPLSSADQQGLDGDRWDSLQIYVVFILNVYYKQQIHHHQSLQNHIAIIFRQENWTRDVPWRPVIYDIFYALHLINYLLFIILHKSYIILYSGKRAGQGMFPDNQSLIEAGLATR